MQTLEHQRLPSSQQHPHAAVPAQPGPPGHACRKNQPAAVPHLLGLQEQGILPIVENPDLEAQELVSPHRCVNWYKVTNGVLEWWSNGKENGFRCRVSGVRLHPAFSRSGFQKSEKQLITKIRNFKDIFRGFVLWFFRDEKMNIEHPTSNIEFWTFCWSPEANPTPETRNLII